MSAYEIIVSCYLICLSRALWHMHLALDSREGVVRVRYAVVTQGSRHGNFARVSRGKYRTRSKYIHERVHYSVWFDHSIVNTPVPIGTRKLSTIAPN